MGIGTQQFRRIRQMQNRPSVEYAVRACLYISPFLFLLLGQYVSYVVASLFIVLEATLLWKMFDYDIKKFPLFVKVINKIYIYKDISEIFGYFLHRIYFTILPFAAFYFLFLFGLRDVFPHLFHALILHHNFAVDVVMGYVNGLPQELSNFTLEEKQIYLSELKLISYQENFYTATKGTYTLFESACVFINVLFISICFEILSLSIFWKKTIKNTELFFTYKLIILRTFSGFLSFPLALLFFFLFTQEKMPMNDPLHDEFYLILMSLFLILSVSIFIYLIESFCVIAFFLHKKWFPSPN